MSTHTMSTHIMSPHIMSPLASQLDGAYRLLQTLVLRTKSGEFYTIEIGESLFNASHAYGAKVTRSGETSRHLGICHGASVEQVVNAAQEMVFAAITGGRPTVAPASLHRPAEPAFGSTL